jgi:hypothetical protein
VKEHKLHGLMDGLTQLQFANNPVWMKFLNWHQP